MRRNMLGPVPGEWDRQWNGWWGDDPPFYAPALTQVRAAARDGDVSVDGGATTINQYLAAGLIDEL